MLQNRKGSRKCRPKKLTRVIYDLDNEGNFIEVKESTKSMFDALKVEDSFVVRKPKKLK